MAHQLPLDVIGAIADVRGVDSTEVEPVLEDCVDTSALQQLADQDTDGWALTFEFAENTVTVTGDGWVHVDGERMRQWSD